MHNAAKKEIQMHERGKIRLMDFIFVPFYNLFCSLPVLDEANQYFCLKVSSHSS